MAIGSKKHTIKIWQIRSVLAIVIVACVFMVFTLYERVVVEQEMAARTAAVEAEYDRLEARQVELEAEVRYLQSEQSIEAEIRKHFDVAREGEQVVIIMDAEEVETIDPVTAATATKSVWWQFWR